jgi:hypothetical protein
MPHRCAARGKPPIPSNKLPMVNSFVLKMHLQNENANRTSSWQYRKYVLTYMLIFDRICVVPSGTGRCQTLRRLSPSFRG